MHQHQQDQPSHDHVGPDKRCPFCKGFIVGAPVTWKGGPQGTVEYCSSDCLLDDWEKNEGRKKRKEN